MLPFLPHFTFTAGLRLKVELGASVVPAAVPMSAVKAEAMAAAEVNATYSFSTKGTGKRWRQYFAKKRSPNHQ